MLDSTVVNFMLSISFGQVICPERSGRDAGPFSMIEAGNIKSQVRANSIEMREANIGYSRLIPRGAFILPICICGKDMLQGLPYHFRSASIASMGDIFDGSALEPVSDT